MPTSVLIIEDHPMYRDGLIQLMKTMLGEATVHAASCAEEALRMTHQLPGPWLVLLDFNLPGMSGTEAIGALLRRFPDAAIVAISASEDRLEVSAALRAGARLFISKSVSTEALAQAIQRVLSGSVVEGQQWITPSVNDVLEPGQASRLTPRQLEILGLLHLSNKEIGLRLGVAEITVKVHVSSLFRVLGVANRTQAMQAARRLSLDGSNPKSQTDS
jgi:DNA-binding NarL/FixJ family response regulator